MVCAIVICCTLRQYYLLVIWAETTIGRHMYPLNLMRKFVFATLIFSLGISAGFAAMVQCKSTDGTVLLTHTYIKQPAGYAHSLAIHLNNNELNLNGWTVVPLANANSEMFGAVASRGNEKITYFIPGSELKSERPAYRGQLVFALNDATLINGANTKELSCSFG